MSKWDYTKICKWNKDGTDFALFAQYRCDGYHFDIQESGNRLFKNNVFPSKVSAILLEEKQEYSQDELVKLNSCGVLLPLLHEIKEKKKEEI